MAYRQSSGRTQAQQPFFIPGKPGILLAISAQPAVNGPAEQGADDRGGPEQPQLLDGPAADEKGYPGAASRVDGRVGDRDADQVDQREAHADGDGRQPLGRAFVGRPMDAP
jgi:hypothetical protein